MYIRNKKVIEWVYLKDKELKRKNYLYKVYLGGDFFLSD